MPQQSTDPKRKRVEAVDLTGDSSTEDEAPAPKVQKAAVNNNAQRRGQHGLVPGSQRAYEPTPTQHSQAERDSWLTRDVDADDVDEIVSSTQAAADNDELQLYGDLPTKIVGVQYYRGMANVGEYILLRREPENPYDSNSIRVDNVSGVQIGHIPRRIAEKLAKYMDRGWMFLEGRLTSAIRQYDCELIVQMYGPDPHTDAGKQLQEKMAADKLKTSALKEAERKEKERQKQREQQRKQREQEERRRLAEARRVAATAGQGSGGRAPGSSQNPQFANQYQAMPGMSSQPVMEDLLEASQRFNPREVGHATDNYGLQEEALKAMPLATKPESIQTKMLPYQLQALQWLLDQENPQLPPPGSKEAVQLWKRQDHRSDTFVNIATNHPTKEAPALASGGILADDMGLGKTLEMISLIVADAEKHGRGTTLVVAPLSVMSNWSGQIAQHVNKDKALNV